MHRFASEIAALAQARHLELLWCVDDMAQNLAATFERAVLVSIPVFQKHGYDDGREVLRLRFYQTINRFAAEPIIPSEKPSMLQVVARKALEMTGADIAKVIPLPTLRQSALAKIAARPGGETLGAGGERSVFEREFSDKEKRLAFRKLLFPKMSQEQARRLVFGKSEADLRATTLRIRELTKLANPDRIANAVLLGASQGWTVNEQVKYLRPMVADLKSTAYRIARTEASRIANEAQFEAYEQIGEWVVGYQIHAVLDERTRPEHRNRNGTIYWKMPQGGQKGLNEMPRPPVEANGQVSPHCRCWVSPIFSTREVKPGVPVKREELAIDITQPDTGRIIPSPLTFDKWFKAADRAKQIKAVGARRFNAVADKLERDPDYLDFVNPVTGDMMTVDELSKEVHKDREARRKILKQFFDFQAANKLRSVAGF